MRDQVIRVATQVKEQFYPDAFVAFAAGSFFRDEATAHSDIDLVVVFDRVDHAYRESFRFDGFPVEAFVHDPETLKYFVLEVDLPTGIPTLAHMVMEGVEIPRTSDLSSRLKAFSASVIEAGPPALSAERRNGLRYRITDLIDDIRSPRSRDELTAVATYLYDLLANYHLRTNGFWSAKGKAIPRALLRREPSVHAKFTKAFDDLFGQGDPSAVIEFANELLRPDGGFLFEGDRRDAPASWRMS